MKNASGSVQVPTLLPPSSSVGVTVPVPSAPIFTVTVPSGTHTAVGGLSQQTTKTLVMLT